MKTLQLFLLTLITILVVSCSGSDTYRGAWKGLNSKGEKVAIDFQAKAFTITDSAGAATNYTYSQNSIRIENSITTYAITIGDGRRFLVSFPMPKNEEVAVIREENGMVLYTMGRKDYVKYEDIVKL